MAGTGACPTCLDTKSLCTGENRRKNFFEITLREGFGEKTVIPCYTRTFFLQRHAVSVVWRKTVKSTMTTAEGFKFIVDVTNVAGMTYVHGEEWKELAMVYGFHVGQKIVFNIDKPGHIDKPGPRVRLTIGNWPIFHPSYYSLSRKKRQIVYNLGATDGRMVHWRMMEHVISHVDNLDKLVARYGAGDYARGRAFGVVHTLTPSNCKKNFVKIPRRVLPPNMEPSGPITIVCHPNSKVSTTCSINVIDDGRLCANSWNVFLAKEKQLVVGHKLLMLLYVGDKGVFLFVSHVPQVDIAQPKVPKKEVVSDGK